MRRPAGVQRRCPLPWTADQRPFVPRQSAASAGRGRRARATRRSCARWSWPAGWGSSRVNLFSGCPGDSDVGHVSELGHLRLADTSTASCSSGNGARRCIPYWREQAALAARNGVRLGFEMHPGFVVYNPAHAAAAARRMRRGASAPTSTRATCSGRASTSRRRSPSSGRRARSSTPTPRTRPSIPRNAALNGVLDTVPLGEVGRAQLGLPDGRLRARRARLAANPERAAAGRLRRRPVDRARGRPALDRRGLPQGRRVPAFA